MKSDSLQASEDLAARGATAPRVTLDDINNYIVGEFYATGDVLLPETIPNDDNVVVVIGNARLLTICLLVLANGFTVIGTSAPASPENFDADKGREFAYKDAVSKVWALMGFALRDRLFNASTSGADTIEVQTIPGDADLDAMDADELVSLAIRHGYPEAGHGRDDAQVFLRVKREGGTYTQPGNTDLSGAITPSTIPGNEELGAMDDNEIYDLARANDLPLGEDPSREHDIASLITKRDSTGAQTNSISASGPPPIEGNEELEAANDGYIKDLVVAHGLEYVDRADAITKLKVRRDSLLSNHGGGQPNPV